MFLLKHKRSTSQYEAWGDTVDWEVRSFVYSHFGEHGLPPAERTASEFGVGRAGARAAYERLDARHAIFLEPGIREVRIAFSSGGPTPLRARSGGRSYWANCVWDMHGRAVRQRRDRGRVRRGWIPGAPVGRGRGAAGWGRGLLVDFPRPLGRWYEDLIFT